MILVIVTKYVKLRSKKWIIVFFFYLFLLFLFTKSLLAAALETCFLIAGYSFASAKVQNIFLNMKFSCSKFAIN